MKDADAAALRRIAAAALEEDLGADGDITTDAVVPATSRGRGRLVARQDLVVAGLPVVGEVFRILDPELEYRPLCVDGDAVDEGATVATVTGAARPILRGERTALNFLMRLSGIATAARRAVEEVAGTGATILDTRKTAPGLRTLEKRAVAAGGARNHRLGLFDAVLIKDTHLALAGSIGEAVRRAHEAGHAPQTISVEVRNLNELAQAIRAGVGRALLDNMSLPALTEAVRFAAGRIVLEASGGLRPGRLHDAARTGVQYLSLGYLTHSAPAADLALDLETLP